MSNKLCENSISTKIINLLKKELEKKDNIDQIKSVSDNLFFYILNATFPYILAILTSIFLIIILQIFTIIKIQNLHHVISEIY